MTSGEAKPYSNPMKGQEGSEYPMTVLKLRVWVTIPLLIILAIGKLNGNRVGSIPLAAFLLITWIIFQSCADLFTKPFRILNPLRPMAGEEKIVPKWLFLSFMSASILAGLFILLFSFVIKLS